MLSAAPSRPAPPLQIPVPERPRLISAPLCREKAERPEGTGPNPFEWFHALVYFCRGATLFTKQMPLISLLSPNSVI